MAESISSICNTIDLFPNNVYINNFDNNKLPFKNCSICLAVIQENSAEFSKDQMPIRNKLYLCCPELVLSINSKTNICISCFKIVNITNGLIRKFYTCNMKLNVTSVVFPMLQNFYSFESHHFVVKNEIKTEELDLSDTDSTTNMISSNSTIVDKTNSMRNYICKYAATNSSCNYNNKQGKDFTLSYLHEVSCKGLESLKNSSKTELNRHISIQRVKKACQAQNNFEDASTPNPIIYSESKLFQELQCGCSANKEIKLKQHIQMHTRKMSLKFPLQKGISVYTRKKSFKCSYCDYSSTWKINLTKQLCTHTGEKPYKCSRCNYSSVTKDCLIGHVRTHTGERPFKCTQCNYSSIRKTSLVGHLRTHTGDKPFKCFQCNYSSTTKISLLIHICTHTGEKPFKCSYCDYSSTLKYLLTNHIRLHTGEKPFKCSHCSFSCSQRRTLKKHIYTHVEEKPFKCSYCEYSSIWKYQLAQHMHIHT